MAKCLLPGCLLLLAVWAAPAVIADPVPEGDLPVYYVIDRSATLYRAPDASKPYMELGFRETVYLLGEEVGWRHVRTRDGAEGYVRARALSNAWIRVSKEQGMVYVYRGAELVRKIPADFGNNAFSDKERRGSRLDPDHWRTPEGVFHVVAKNAHSQYHRALVLNYPTAEDAKRGLRKGLITQAEYQAIVSADKRFEMPPMGTALGGWIEIHGHGTGGGVNWTQGCVAIENKEIDHLWNWVEVGTPVIIEP